MIKISEDVMAVLKAAEFTSTSVKLQGQLNRPLYEKVNKVLESSGGKWNRKAKAHVFGEDPRRVLGVAVHTGELNPEDVDLAAALDNGLKGSAFVRQLFPTPPDLARRMVGMAKIQPGDRVLEPSAGTGNILQAIGPEPDKVGVEIDQRAVDVLLRGGMPSGTRLHCADFLKCGEEMGKFDVVIMNPPFSNLQDIKHILHAFRFLKPGGRLVAICGNGPRQNRELRPLIERFGGTWEDLPAGTFGESGTNVNAALITLATPL